MSAEKAVEVTVSGRVQGVFFRAATREQARRLGVHGWVRNEADGTVAALFEGPAEAVESLVAWCHEGPPSAQVREVRDVPAEPTGASTFEVVD